METQLLGASVTYAHNVLFVQVPVMLVSIGVPLSEHYVLYSLVLLASVIGLVSLIKLADNLPVSLSFRLALLFMACAFGLLLIIAPSWVGIAIAGILFFTGFNFLEAKMPAMLSSIAPAGSKGSAMGIYASHQFFGAFLGGVSSGLLNSYFSPQYTFIMCLVVIFLLSLIATGLATGTQRIQRVTLRLESRYIDAKNLQHLHEKISNMAGVSEAHTSVEENAMYLKVNAKVFDMTAAEAFLKEAR